MTDAISTPLACKQHVYSPSRTTKIFDTSPVRDLAGSPSTIFSRLFASLIGAGIVAASTFSIVSAQNLHGSDAALPLALAAGLIAGAVVLPRAGLGLGIVIAVALICGEGFGLISQMDRVVMLRDAQTNTINGSNDARHRAERRLDRALQTQAAQRTDAANTVTLPSCKTECRLLLESQSTALGTEVTESRNHLAQVTAQLGSSVRSAHPLASRLGIDPVVLDLVAAGLLSVGANLLGAALVAFGARPGTVSSHTQVALPEHPGQSQLTAPAEQVNATLVPALGTLANAGPSRVKAAEAVVINLQERKQVPSNVRGLAALIGSSPTSTHIAVAALLSAGVIERAGDVLVMAKQVA